MRGLWRPWRIYSPRNGVDAFSGTTYCWKLKANRISPVQTTAENIEIPLSRLCLSRAGLGKMWQASIVESPAILTAIHVIF